MKDIWLIVLGWFMGLFSYFFGEFQKSFRQKIVFKRIVLRELKEVKYKMSISVSLFSDRVPDYDKDVYPWVFEQIKDYDGLKSEIDKNLIEQIKKVLKLSISEEERKVIHEKIYEEKKGRSLAIKKIKLRYLDEHFDKLDYLKPELQISLIKILDLIEAINSDIDLYYSYNDKTFDSNLSEENRELVDANIQNTYIIFKDRYKHGVNLINKFIVETKFNWIETIWNKISDFFNYK